MENTSAHHRANAVNLLSATMLAALGLLLNGCHSHGALPSSPALHHSHQQVVKWDGTMVFNHPENPFLKEIPDDAPVHPNSSAMIKLIRQNSGRNNANTYVIAGQFGSPVYFANDNTKKRNIKITRYHMPTGKSTLVDVPIPFGAAATAGSDKHLIVIDNDSNCAHEFWLFKNTTAGAGNAIDIRSSGIYLDGRSTVAAGWSQLQGLIWPKELQDGSSTTRCHLLFR